MSANLHPATMLLIGAIVLLPLRGRALKVALLFFPIAGFVHMLFLRVGMETEITFLGFALEPVRVDRLSLLFGYLFHLAAFMGAVYALHLKDKVQLVSALLYAGSAVGVVFAGDLITLFVFWELLAGFSVFQIWARRNERSLVSGIRYLLMQVFSGLLLLAGAAVQYHGRGSLHFDAMFLEGASAWLIFIAFGIKCGFPLLHTWLIDGYPEATPTGSVFLSSFTTKAAVYALARGFPGAEPLIVIGAVMAVFPIFYAVIENDLRRVLGYSMINQIGFMVVGIGLGTPLSINGAIAHAFNDVFFKGLLFMSMGAVLFRTGSIKASKIGGLYKSMPWTTGFCIVGASSISGFPLLCGFVSKSMVMVAAGEQGLLLIWLALLFASAGVVHHAGIKIPFCAFFARDRGLRPKEAPLNMLIAMGFASMLCVIIGSFPNLFLYRILPCPVDYVPYTLSHVVTQIQLLLFAALADVVLKLTGVYPHEVRSVNIDADWVWRKGGRIFTRLCDGGLNGFNSLVHRIVVDKWISALSHFFHAAPSRTLVFLSGPIFRLEGFRGAELRDRQRDLYGQARLGAIPVGFTAVLTVLILVILFWF